MSRKLKVHIHNHDGFNEGDHPRASNGEFGSGGGKSRSWGESHAKNAAAYVKGLTGKEKMKIHAAAEEEGMTPEEYVQEANSPEGLAKKLKKK